MIVWHNAWANVCGTLYGIQEKHLCKQYFTPSNDMQFVCVGSLQWGKLILYRRNGLETVSFSTTWIQISEIS